jgi:hypothetical protein
VKAFIHGGREEAKACPAGTRKDFTWYRNIYDYGRNADAYLYVA